MGCCQINNEQGEVYMPNLQLKTLEERNGSRLDSKAFAEISLESHYEETDINPRYTNQSLMGDFASTIRLNNCSFHRNELEQSFLQTGKNRSSLCISKKS